MNSNVDKALATHIEPHSIQQYYNFYQNVPYCNPQVHHPSRYQPHAHPHYFSCTHTKKFAGIHSNEAILQVTTELCNFETHIKKKIHKPYSHPTEINPTIYKANKRELTQFRQLGNQINHAQDWKQFRKVTSMEKLIKNVSKQLYKQEEYAYDQQETF